MTSIYLLRHGESALNVRHAEIVGGRSNHTPLTSTGEAQARHAGEWMLRHGIRPDVAIASPARRTINTTSLALQAMALADIPVTIDSRIQELSQGIMESKERATVWTEQTIEQLHKDPIHFSFPQGESLADVQERMLDWYYDVVKRYPDGTILTGGHGLSIRALVGALLNWDHQTIIDSSTPNCSLTHITDNAGVATVSYIGRPTIDINN